MKTRILTRVPLPILAAILASSAAAHLPATLQTEFEVEDATVSQAIYGEFVEGDEVFTVHYDFPRPFALPFEMLVPHKKKWRDHRPAFAVVGPGLPPPTADELALLPRALPAGWGAFVELDEHEERLVIFESFMRRMLWSTGPTALAMDQGPAEVWIWSPDGTTGDFIFGFGVEEDFSDGGFTKVFEDWSTYAY